MHEAIGAEVGNVFEADEVAMDLVSPERKGLVMP